MSRLLEQTLCVPDFPEANMPPITGRRVFVQVVANMILVVKTQREHRHGKHRGKSYGLRKMKGQRVGKVTNISPAKEQGHIHDCDQQQVFHHAQ